MGQRIKGGTALPWAMALGLLAAFAMPTVAGGMTHHPKKTRHPKAAGPLFHQSGSGTATTAYFTAPTNWTLRWSYTCKSFGSEGNFAVIIAQNGTGTMASLEDGPVNEIGTGASGTQHYHYGGKLFLKVDSECSWSLKAVR